MSTGTLSRAAVDRTGCPAPRHGSLAAYKHHQCRCPDAREAGRISNAGRAVRSLRAKPGPGEVVGYPTRDRLRVLVALGYDISAITALLPGVAVRELMTCHQSNVPVSVAAQVRDVFADVISWPAPFGRAADEATALAVRSGWGVVDLVAVRRALAGSGSADRTRPVARVPLTRLERRAVMFAGEVLGYSVTAISRAAGASGATVESALLLPTPSMSSS